MLYYGKIAPMEYSLSDKLNDDLEPAIEYVLPPEIEGALSALSTELGIIKKRIVELPKESQIHRDYFIALLAGAEKTANVVSLDPSLGEQITFARQSLDSVAEAITTYQNEIEWYRKKNISITDNEQVETNVRSEVVNQLHIQFNLSAKLLARLNKNEAENPSLHLIHNMLAAKLNHLAENLDTLHAITFSEAFTKKIKVIEIHLTDITHTILSQLDAEQILEADRQKPWPETVTPVSRYNQNLI